MQILWKSTQQFEIPRAEDFLPKIKKTSIKWTIFDLKKI